LQRVEKWAAANGCSRSEGIVRLLERGLAAEPAPAKPRRSAKDKP